MRRSFTVACILALVALAVPLAAAEGAGGVVIESQGEMVLDGHGSVHGIKSRFIGEQWASVVSAEGGLTGVTANHYSWQVASADAPYLHVRSVPLAAIESTKEWSRADVRFDLNGDPATLVGTSSEGGLAVEGSVHERGRPVVLEGDAERGISPLGNRSGSHPYERLPRTLPQGWFLIGGFPDTGPVVPPSWVDGYPAIEGARLLVHGPAKLEFTGGEVSLFDGQNLTRYRLGAREDPALPGVWHLSALVLTFEDADWPIPLPASWAYASPQIRMDVEGSLLVEGATGTSDVEGYAGSFDGENVDIVGSLHVAPAVLQTDAFGRPVAFRYTVTGDIRQITVGGRTTFDAAEAAAIAASAAGALGIGAYLHHHGIFGRILGVFYHRLPASDVLGNPTRRRIMEVVREHPAIHMREISRHLDLTWGRLLHHLAVLERSRHVVIRQRGRYRVVVASHDFPVLEFAPEPLHPLTHHILEVVREDGNLRARDLQERLGVSRQRLAYHLRKLESAHLLDVQHTPQGLVLKPAALVRRGEETLVSS